MGVSTRGMRTQNHTSDTKAAIGYVRVRTQEQATEGVSLDAARTETALTTPAPASYPRGRADGKSSPDKASIDEGLLKLLCSSRASAASAAR